MGSGLFSDRVISWWTVVLLLVGGSLGGKCLLLYWMLTVNPRRTSILGVGGSSARARWLGEAVRVRRHDALGHYNL